MQKRSFIRLNLLAIRLARSFNGRVKIAKAQGSFHGHADHTVVGSSTVGIQPNSVPSGVAPNVVNELVDRREAVRAADPA